MLHRRFSQSALRQRLSLLHKKQFSTSLRVSLAAETQEPVSVERQDLEERLEELQLEIKKLRTLYGGKEEPDYRLDQAFEDHELLRQFEESLSIGKHGKKDLKQRLSDTKDGDHRPRGVPYQDVFGHGPPDRLHIKSYSYKDGKYSGPYNGRATRRPDVPRLSHNLKSVLFRPGVHFLKDPRTKTYNFSTYLENIVKYENFDFDKVQPFISVPKDKVLLNMALKHNLSYYSSTSSMTPILTKFYLLLNNYSGTKESPRFEFPRFNRTVLELPASVIVLPKGKKNKAGKSVYSVSSDKSGDTEILLSAMGHCLEAFLTTTEQDFKNYLLDNPESLKEAVMNDQNAYSYISCGKLLMRSQLDCYQDGLPGTGTFDLKTRAVCAIRQDRLSDAANNTYQIWRQTGPYESFSREFDDLIRTGALLKYAFQARIGQMDGIFVAYHNIRKFFGFQYLPLEEIDRIFYNDLHVQAKIINDKVKQKEVTLPEDNLPQKVATLQFKASLDIWTSVMDRAIADLEALGYKDTAFRLIFLWKAGDDKKGSKLYASAVPITPEQEEELQTFLGNFQTSFKEDITQEQRAKNLEHFRKELDKLNLSLAQKAPVLGYTIFVDQFFNGKKLYKQHPYPSCLADHFEVKYKIANPICSQPGDRNTFTRDRYMDAMRKVSSMLTSSMQPKGTDKLKNLNVDVLRYFSKVGEIRELQGRVQGRKGNPSKRGEGVKSA